MFGFGKKKKLKDTPPEENQRPQKKTRADKLVMGAILGVAIGSVISMSLMPKKNNKPAPAEENHAPARRSIFSLFKRKKAKNKASITENPKKIPTEFE